MQIPDMESGETKDPFDTHGFESFELIRDVMSPMRDGTKLAADLYRPNADTPVPVILELARLTNVHPDGRSIDIADGSCRLTAQGSPVHIDLGDTATTIRSGHCLRLGFFASNHPRVPRRTRPADLSVTIRTNPSSSMLQLSVLDDN